MYIVVMVDKILYVCWKARRRIGAPGCPSFYTAVLTGYKKRSDDGISRQAVVTYRIILHRQGFNSQSSKAHSIRMKLNLSIPTDHRSRRADHRSKQVCCSNHQYYHKASLHINFNLHLPLPYNYNYILHFLVIARSDNWLASTSICHGKLTCTSSLSYHLLSHQVSRPQALHDVIPVLIKIERTSSVLWRFTMRIYVWTVNISSFLPMHNQTNAVLQQEENSGATTTGV